MPLLLIPEYSGINKGRRIPDTGLHSLASLLYLSQTSYANKLTAVTYAHIEFFLVSGSRPEDLTISKSWQQVRSFN